MNKTRNKKNLYDLAFNYFEKGKYSRSEECYKTFITNNPKHALAYDSLLIVLH